MKKQVEELLSLKEESKEVVNENSENNIDWYHIRLPGESIKKNFDESISQDDNEFEQAELERDLNSLNISTSQKVWDTDDKSEYFQKLNDILDSKGSDKLTLKLNWMTLEHQVNEIKDIDNVDFGENKSNI